MTESLAEKRDVFQLRRGRAARVRSMATVEEIDRGDRKLSPALARLLAAHETQLVMAADHVAPEQLIATLTKVQAERQRD